MVPGLFGSVMACLQRQAAAGAHLRLEARRQLDGEPGADRPAAHPGSSAASSSARRSMPGIFLRRRARTRAEKRPDRGAGFSLAWNLRYHSVFMARTTCRVLTLAPMPPEKCAYALARYSRSPDSIRESLDWVRDARFAEVPGALLLSVRPRLHRRPGPPSLCFEGISELAAIEIEDEPLWDGQAKSSRYQDFSRSRFRHAAGVSAGRGGARTRRGGRSCWRPTSRSTPRVAAHLRGRAAASRRHEAGRLPAQHRRARVRRRPLPAVPGIPTNVGQIDQHPHAREADPAVEGVRIRGAARAWPTRSPQPAPPSPAASGMRQRPREPVAPTLAQ